MSTKIILREAWEARSKLRAEGSKLRAEGGKLHGEGNKFYLEAVGEYSGVDPGINWITGEITVWRTRTIPFGELL